MKLLFKILVLIILVKTSHSACSAGVNNCDACSGDECSTCAVGFPFYTPDKYGCTAACTANTEYLNSD